MFTVLPFFTFTLFLVFTFSRFYVFRVKGVGKPNTFSLVFGLEFSGIFGPFVFTRTSRFTPKDVFRKPYVGNSVKTVTFSGKRGSRCMGFCRWKFAFVSF